MKRLILGLSLAVAACAHRAPVIERQAIQAPAAVVRHPLLPLSFVPLPTLAKSTRARCAEPETPSLPDNTAAPDLKSAISRLTTRDKIRADYERRLRAALRACTR